MASSSCPHKMSLRENLFMMMNAMYDNCLTKNGDDILLQSRLDEGHYVAQPEPEVGGGCLGAAHPTPRHARGVGLPLLWSELLILCIFLSLSILYLSIPESKTLICAHGFLSRF